MEKGISKKIDYVELLAHFFILNQTLKIYVFKEMYDYAHSESLLRISQPRGEFFWENENPVLFFAGGIGVTPAIAIMRTLAHRGENPQFHLDWCASHPEDFVFQQELEQLIAHNPHLSLKLRATKTDDRISAKEVQSKYPWTEGAVAFMCGPEAYMNAVRGYLKQSGWPDLAIRQELFSSKLDDQGKAQKSKHALPAIQLAGGLCPVEHDSFNVGPIGSVMQEAEAFLKQCYLERGLSQVFKPRWDEVVRMLDLLSVFFCLFCKYNLPSIHQSISSSRVHSATGSTLI